MLVQGALSTRAYSPLLTYTGTLTSGDTVYINDMNISLNSQPSWENKDFNQSMLMHRLDQAHQGAIRPLQTPHTPPSLPELQEIFRLDDSSRDQWAFYVSPSVQSPVALVMSLGQLQLPDTPSLTRPQPSKTPPCNLTTN